MSASDAGAIWNRLRSEGRLVGEAPMHEAAAPWYLRLLAGAGAWLASLLLLGFVGMLLGDLLSSGTAALFIGLMTCAGAVALLRQAQGEFLRQGATAACQAGVLLIGLGLVAGLDVSANSTAFALVIVSALLYAAAPVFVHRFLCACVLTGAALWLLTDNLPRLALLQPLPAWAAAGLWLWRGLGDPAQAREEWLAPVAWATTLAALVLAWWLPEYVTPGAIVASKLLAAMLLPVTAILLAWPHRHERGRGRLVLLVAAAVLLAGLWWPAPGITFAITLLLIAWALGAPTLLAVAVAGLATYLIAYYYQLAVPLLVKAQWLGIAGAATLALHLLNRRWRRGEVS